MPAEKSINFPGVNGCAICDCGGTMFRVGIGADELGNNDVRCLECTSCGYQLAVPFFDSGKRTPFQHYNSFYLALQIIAGEKPNTDTLMSHSDIARWILSKLRKPKGGTHGK